MAASIKRKLIDIGANLTDPMYRGIYHGSLKHQDDLAQVIERALSNGLKKIIVTGVSLEDSQRALDLATTNKKLFSTVGCHPTKCLEMENQPEKYLENLASLSSNDKVVAFGEFGLDYERLEFCPKDTQVKYFTKQLLLKKKDLPLFLHCRKSANDLFEILQKHRESFKNGVVHSFDGSVEEARQFLDLGLHIGINGCSLKTEENLQVVSTIPQNRLLIETDCPWCEVRRTHPGFKYVKTFFPSSKKEKWKAGEQIKGRNEPVNLIHILEVLAAVRGEEEEELMKALYENTQNLFFNHHSKD